MSFADNVKQLRNSRELTQKQVATALGITSRTWQNYELGICMPRTEKMARRIAKFFDVPLAELLSPEEYYIINTSKNGSKKSARGNKKSGRDLKTLLSELKALYSNGKLSKADKDLIVQTLNELSPDHKPYNHGSDSST